MALAKKKKKTVLPVAGSTPTQSAQRPAYSSDMTEGAWEQFRAFWPESFVPPKRALFLFGVWALLAVLLCAAALLGSFTAVKETVAGFLQLRMPDRVDPGNFDFAFVIIALSGVTIFSLIHPALGLSLILLARTWLDGYTFQLDNIYFEWSIFLLSFVWLIRVYQGKAKLRPSPPLLILTAFFIYIRLTLPFSWQYGQSYPLVWLWASYLVLFAVSVEMTRETAVRKLLVFIFLAAMAAQAFFSILHYEYLLPYLRTIIQNPAILRHYFNTDVITPDLARRFMVNRAFGTMLFPNALAAFLVLGIPFSFALWSVSLPSFRRARKVMLRRKQEISRVRDRMVLLGIATFIGMVAFILFMFISYFPKEYRLAETPLPWYLSTAALVTGALFVACGTAVLFLFHYLPRFEKLSDCWAYFRAPLLALISLLLLYTIWITYSRGALLALIMASAFSFMLYKIPPDKLSGRAFFRAKKSVLFIFLLLCLLFLSPLIVHSFSVENSWAQPGPEAAAGSNAMPLKSEGVAVTTSDLTDPTTFGFRLGYWRVALRMALDNWKCGVGLGNFHVGYPCYQYIGAGDVREAHNGYLQYFCETGLLGGLLFVSFWIVLLGWGGWRILQQQNKMEKRVLAGMYAGILAFLIHAFLDINFSHPSLMMILFFLCGAFYSRTSDSAPEGQAEEGEASSEGAMPQQRDLFRRGAALFLMVALVLAGHGGFRLYKQHLALNGIRMINLSWEDAQRTRLQNIQFYIHEVRQFALARDRGEDTSKPPRLSLTAARLLIHDPEVLETGFVFYRPDPGTPGKFHRIDEGGPVPDNALAIVRKPWYLHKQAVRAGLEHVNELIQVDNTFPYSTELALHIAKWYELYMSNVHGPTFTEDRVEWGERLLEWADIVVSRNPHHADLHLFQGNCFMTLGPWFQAPDDRSRDYMKQAEACYEEMLKYCPISPSHHWAYTHSLESMAEWYREKEEIAQAEIYEQRAAVLRKKAQDLQLQRSLSHVYP